MEISDSAICKRFIKKLKKEINELAKKESIQFKKEIHYSHIGDLHQAEKVIKMYNK